MQEQVFNLKEYDFDIPKGLIAQEPPVSRDGCGLLVVDRKDSAFKAKIFKDVVDYFSKGDVLVLNDTKVIKAKLFAIKVTGARLEVLLIKEKDKGVWECLVNPAKRVKIGDVITFKEGELTAKIIDKCTNGARVLEFTPKNLSKFLSKTGKVPLPPYIKKEFDEFGYYQTVYAKQEGAIAAPTAGLHFTKELIKKLTIKGVKVVYVTLHCGLATFRPVKVDDIRNHKIESEWLEVSPSAAKIINQAKQNCKKVIAVGTTAIRTLESIAFLNDKKEYRVNSFSGDTSLYITPGYKFKIVDSIITNFHTPASTNLVLIASFCGFDLTKSSYMYAKKQNFRFYSFGDAMLIV